MVDCGMAPTAALHAATGSAAELMGLEHELGTLKPGQRADLIILDGDPSDLTALTSRIHRVYQDGRVVHDDQAGPSDRRTR